MSGEDKPIDDSLRGIKVCVLNGNDIVSVQNLQKILLKMGAQTVANTSKIKLRISNILGKTTNFCVAMVEKSIKCAAVIKSSLCHIVNGNWLLKCEEKNKLVLW